MSTIYWVLYVIVFLMLLFFTRIEFALTFMIGAFFAIRHLPRRVRVASGMPSEEVTSPIRKVSNVEYEDEFDYYENHLEEDRIYEEQGYVHESMQEEVVEVGSDER
ncbi:hypothetical protein [Alkalihalobacillus sp. CinArs1]|uniref:hypothetical protein n=1 Tax=Alkalihalobacillus sp. CinArs1 TaxID=2995314 RepID=UPI0022DD0086|nr:hypothetical protein [Alkalihalobacillus sp. CinArs1]